MLVVQLSLALAEQFADFRALVRVLRTRDTFSQSPSCVQACPAGLLEQVVRRLLPTLLEKHPLLAPPCPRKAKLLRFPHRVVL